MIVSNAWANSRSGRFESRTTFGTAPDGQHLAVQHDQDVFVFLVVSSCRRGQPFCRYLTGRAGLAEHLHRDVAMAVCESLGTLELRSEVRVARVRPAVVDAGGCCASTYRLSPRRSRPGIFIACLRGRCRRRCCLQRRCSPVRGRRQPRGPEARSTYALAELADARRRQPDRLAVHRQPVEFHDQ